MQVNLRQIEEWDLPQLRDWRNGSSLRPTFREYRLLNMVNQRDWFEHISRSPKVEMFGIEYQDDLVGVCGLCSISWVNRSAEVSLYVQGYAVAGRALELLAEKAFEEFNLHRLWAEVYEFDAVKIAALKQMGFILEGKLRAAVFKKGKYYDSLMYGLLKEEQCSTDQSRS